MKQKILAVLMIIAVLLCFMPTMAFAGGETSASQIGKYYVANDSTGVLEDSPTLEGKTEQTYENGQVKVDKTISSTAEENVFDVTLSVKTTDIEIQTETSEDAAVVLVIDTSGSMEGDRISKAKEAAQTFINNFVASDSMLLEKLQS